MRTALQPRLFYLVEHPSPTHIRRIILLRLANLDRIPRFRHIQDHCASTFTSNSASAFFCFRFPNHSQTRFDATRTAHCYTTSALVQLETDSSAQHSTMACSTCRLDVSPLCHYIHTVRLPCSATTFNLQLPLSSQHYPTIRLVLCPTMKTALSLQRLVSTQLPHNAATTQEPAPTHSCHKPHPLVP